MQCIVREERKGFALLFGVLSTASVSMYPFTEQQSLYRGEALMPQIFDCGAIKQGNYTL